MFKRLNTYLITHYPAIWRSKIVYILFATILLSLLTPLNQIDNEKRIHENYVQRSRIDRKLSQLKQEQQNIEHKHQSTDSIFFEIMKIRVVLGKEEIDNYKDIDEKDLYNYRKYKLNKLEKLYIEQKQVLSIHKSKEIKIYLTNLEKIDSLRTKKQKLLSSIYKFRISEKFSRNIISYGIFLWILCVFLWLYTQYLNPTYLRKYYFSDVLKVTILNFISIFIFLIPLLLLVFLTAESGYQIITSNYWERFPNGNWFAINVIRIG